MTILTSERLGALDDDELAAYYSSRFQGLLAEACLNDIDDDDFIEVDRRANLLDQRHKPKKDKKPCLKCK